MRHEVSLWTDSTETRRSTSGTHVALSPATINHQDWRPLKTCQAVGPQSVETSGGMTHRLRPRRSVGIAVMRRSTVNRKPIQPYQLKSNAPPKVDLNWYLTAEVAPMRCTTNGKVWRESQSRASSPFRDL
ncbi:hypothetical protein CH63R_08684 [Colletotrichum higginsianum IMI 349063]|uniref:Uncharacterized protein n=1 Tax=Colletotrichum higginsianum (strain IMI 349063) TaxID=759273 RepID=A0A1B7Y592_COLHI|nr:hypothetical protein CH63R_08684 [Colletotrichum higginsianum IMI 349063]OBR07163.1 hypothetical protein CH63R_08684 [Colletotrichum higginsianum IMI 349063]